MNAARPPATPTARHNGRVDEPIPVTRTVDHGTAKLMPDVDRRRAWLLTVDGAPQSYVDLDAPEHLEFEYARPSSGMSSTVRASPESRSTCCISAVAR